jgi:aryl-alcohol dehydrogenase-like predicted oxidoreductase
MSVFDRLVLGVANWGPTPYGHHGVTCPRSEQEKIIAYAMCCGIRTIDTAVAYNVDLSWVPTAFDIVMKVRGCDEVPKDGWSVLMAHDSDAYDKIQLPPDNDERGVSWYDPQDKVKYTLSEFAHRHDWMERRPGVVQIPYSPFDRRWEDEIVQTHEWAQIQVRSVFCQGKVFTSDESVFVRFRKYASELGLPVGTLCILFCLLNPNVDKVIIGVDSEQQLRENLRFFHRLDSFGVADAKIIDPRLWPTT